MGSLAFEPETPVFDPATLFSRRVQRWEPGAIRSLLPLEAIPGMISLVAGKPNPATFPFSKISVTLNGPDEKTLVLDGAALSEALQYNLPAGHPGLLKWLEGLQQAVHGISSDGSWMCCVGNGSQELIHKAFQVFCDPGDPVMLETPAYPGVSAFLRADGHELVEVCSGADGVDPSDLERVLSTWPEHRRRPKVLYTVPTGSNPTGRSCTEINKARILRLAKRFDFMIFEDDAYYFLNFEEDPSKRARSYLALEQEVNGETGRVMRTDSLSKIVSSGMRLGILTGPVPAVQKVVKITENVNLQPSTTTQVLALTLFRHWGYTGFVEHCARAAEFYRGQRDAFAAAAERHLRGRATWEVPTAGMFFWIRLLLPPGSDSFELLSKKGIDNRILAIPGMAFLPNARKACQLRASYSLVSVPDMDEACRRIAKLVDDAWRDEFANTAKADEPPVVLPAPRKITA
ncbi:aminotransferase [Parachaetomium inaequale]|uniref:Aminotransferase n=1 Tax=Parachaetomium inaequale TaxID=2588326 RepID=A0AAN6ST45_9PEZI|nr:aminotransferase [Parachaetomium inaequale]